MSRVYAVTFENVTVSAAQELFYLAPAANKVCVLHGFSLSNVGGTADAGDAQEELLRLLVRRGHTTASSGGTAPTPAPLNETDAAAGFTASVNDTTLATLGTTVDLHADGWNVRIPYQQVWTPETRPVFKASETSLVIRLAAAPADPVAVSGTAWVEEI